MKRLCGWILVILLLVSSGEWKTLAEEEDVIAINLVSQSSIPESWAYYKLERIELDPLRVAEAIEKYCLPEKEDEIFVLQVNQCSNPDLVLYYKEQNGKLETASIDYLGAPSYQCEESRYQMASETVKAFLNEVGLTEYEYPFFYCDERFRTLCGTVWEPLSETEFLHSGIVSSDTQANEWDRTDGPLIQVVVRFTLDEIPLGASVSWTAHSSRAGNGNPTPVAVFLVTPTGQIAEIQVRNPFTIIREQIGNEDVLGWEQVLNMNMDQLISRYCSGVQEGNSLTLRFVEFIYLTNDKNVTYPAWHFVFETHMGDAYWQNYCSGLSADARTSMLGIYFDARSGSEV